MPKTIVTSLLAWLRANTPQVANAWLRLAHGEQLIDPSVLIDPTKWNRLPNGNYALEGWIILADGLAKLRFIHPHPTGWSFVPQPEFQRSDLSPVSALATGEFTFLLPDIAYTAIRDPNGALAEATIIKV